MKKIIMFSILLLLALLPLASATMQLPLPGKKIIKPTIITKEEVRQESDGYKDYSTLPLRTTLYFPFGKLNFKVGDEICSFSYNGFGKYSQKCSAELQYEVMYQNWHRSYVKVFI